MVTDKRSPQSFRRAAAGPETSSRLIADALAEDVGGGDVTTLATVGAEARARAVITQKAPGVVYGIAVAAATFNALDPAAKVEALTEEGVWRESGGVLAVAGLARAILTAERTALNFLAHLSGVASAAARCVAAVEGTVRVLDTRKTTPGLRSLEKAAAAAGGALNHRVGLYDRILIKENHIAAAGGIGEAVRLARAASPGLAESLEVECRSLTDVDEALVSGARRLLLDNMSAEQLAQAVRQVGGRASCEASGGVTLDNIRELAETGVNFISVGAITHSAPALDLSLILEPL